MPRWITSTLAGVERTARRYLPRRSTPVTLAPSSALDERAFLVWRRIEREIVDLDVLDPLADDLALQLASDGLDFGQLRHGRLLPSVMRGVVGAPSSDALGLSGPALGLVAARDCQASPGGGLLGLLLRLAARPGPVRRPPMRTTAEKRRSWSGPVARHLVAGHLAELAGRAPGAGSCGRPARARRRPRPRRSASRGSTSRAGGVQPAVEVDRADDGLEGVGQDRRACRARRWRPRPCPGAGTGPSSSSAATSASAAALTTAARTLASSPSGMAAVDLEEVVGDDQAEHGVAEELEALVGRRAGVLRAPRAVGHGQREEHGIGERRGRGGRPSSVMARSVMSTDPSSRHRRASAEAGDDVVDGVADRLEVLEVLVLDAEPDRALAELLLEGLDQLDQGQRVGVEVVGEGVALVDLAGSISRMSARRSRMSSRTS